LFGYFTKHILKKLKLQAVYFVQLDNHFISFVNLN
jgi:hypothetical protein